VLAGEHGTDGGGRLPAAVGRPADVRRLAPSFVAKAWTGAEGRTPPNIARQAAAARKDRAGGAQDAARETAERDPLSVSSMRRRAGISYSSVQADWMCARAEAHLVKTSRSRAIPLRAKSRWVGLYLDPPGHGARSLRRGKEQIQALDLTQPGLPMKKGRAGTMDHDLKAMAHDLCAASTCWTAGDRDRATQRLESSCAFQADDNRDRPVSTAPDRRQLCHP